MRDWSLPPRPHTRPPSSRTLPLPRRAVSSNRAALRSQTIIGVSVWILNGAVREHLSSLFQCLSLFSLPFSLKRCAMSQQVTVFMLHCVAVFESYHWIEVGGGGVGVALPHVQLDDMPGAERRSEQE